ncbi:protein kinase domain-containing protein [Streptomyces sp. NPDC001970]
MSLALKANVPDHEGSRDKATELEQEDRHLLHLAKAHAVDRAYRVDAGPWEDGRWLAVQWLDGIPLWRALAPARRPTGDRPSVRRWLHGLARTWAQRLAALHAAGWAHADVQPTNTLVDAGTVHLIDYALACGPDDAERLPYRGALTHTTAPEIADAILSTSDDTHIQARSPADVWGLGASLFWCWTGQRPVFYEDAVDRTVKLRMIARGRTVPLEEVRPWAFPDFEHVINLCMAPSPDERPSAADLADMLAEDVR